MLALRGKLFPHDIICLAMTLVSGYFDVLSEARQCCASTCKVCICGLQSSPHMAGLDGILLRTSDVQHVEW